MNDDKATKRGAYNGKRETGRTRAPYPASRGGDGNPENTGRTTRREENASTFPVRGRGGAHRRRMPERATHDEVPDDALSADAPEECVVCGRNAVRELLESGRDLEKLYIQAGEREGSVRVLLGEATARHIPILEVERTRLDVLSRHNVHQGIVAIAASRNYDTVEDILAEAQRRGEKPFVVVCDGVEDPHNLGAIVRSAECCGAHGVIIPKRRAVGLTPVVVKASAGASEHMRVAKVTNLTRTLIQLKEAGLWICAADMDGEDYERVDFTVPVALVLGNEGEGISRLVRRNCDLAIRVPLYGKVNSLNVSAAGAILLAEGARQRKRK